METNNLINKVAGELPEDWQIIITCERGSAWIEIIDYYGNDRSDLVTCEDLDLETMVKESLKSIKDYVIANEENE